MIGVVEDFIAVTEEEMIRLGRRLSSGSCKSIEEYRALCGEIHAYKRSIENITAIHDKHYESED